MSLGVGHDASSRVSTQYNAATDAAQLASRNSVIANPGAVVITGKSGNTTYKIKKGATVTFSSSSDSTLLAALDQVRAQSDTNAAALASSQTSNAKALADAQKANAQQIDALLAQVASLAENKQTDGTSSQNKIVLYVVMAIIAGVAAIWIFRK